MSKRENKSSNYISKMDEEEGEEEKEEEKKNTYLPKQTINYTWKKKKKKNYAKINGT